MMSVVKAAVRPVSGCKEHDQTTRSPERRAFCHLPLPTHQAQGGRKGGWSPEEVNLPEGTSEEQALRASRWAHDIRQWARCRRVNGSVAVGLVREATGGEVSVTVCVRSKAIHSRRVWHRLQSPHRIG